jgi:tetratricopeptide (TPR) repeat protein
MRAPITDPPPPAPEQLAAWAEAERETEREIAAADAAARAAAASAESAAAPGAGGTAAPAGRSKRLLLFAGVGLLTAASSVGSAIFLGKKPLPAPEAPTAHAGSASPTDPVSADVIDTTIRAGSYTEALELCRRARVEQPRARHRGLAYREAVCLEALGRLKEAADSYRHAELAPGDRAMWVGAVLGQVRCALASGDAPAAQTHLDRAALRAGHPDCAGTHVAEECLFLRARLAALRLGPVRAMDPFAPTAVAWPPLAAPGDKCFDWLPPDGPIGPSAGPIDPNTVRIHPVAGAFVVTAHLAERPVAAVVRELARAAGLKLEMGDPAAEVLAKDSVVVDVESAQLGDVLDALVTGCGAGWKIDGDTLVVALGSTAPVERAAVARAFQRAVEAVPGHPSVLSARVWLANFEFEAGRPRAAAPAYLHLIEAAPEAPETPYAVYNLGLAELSTGALQAARSRFVDLADRAPRSQWADYAWWWVGRTHFDVGDFTASKRAFEGARTGRTREVLSAAAIGVCALELLDGTEERARAALEAQRGDPRPIHAALRDAFEAVLRYRGGPTPSRKAAVLATLREAGDLSALGPGGTLIAGRAYRDLGQSERTVALFDAAAVATRGPLAQRMAFDVAEWYDLLAQNDPARQRYLAIAVSDPRGLGPKAELRLAEMALREKKVDECLRRCRGLLARDGVERAAVLAVMGRGYEQKKNYRAAADCFAGRVPAE